MYSSTQCGLALAKNDNDKTAGKDLPGEVDTTHMNTVHTSTLEFDLGEQQIMEVAKGIIPDHQGVTDKLWLKNYFSRPVQIGTYSWSEGSNIFKSFFPLHLFLTSSTMADKIKSYPRIRATINLEFVLNASPYQYGGLVMSIKPLATEYGGAVAYSTQTAAQNVSQMVMLPHVMIDPAKNTSAKMSIPFICPNEWWDAVSVSDLKLAAKASIQSIDVLRSCSSEVGNPIDISVYCFLTDVELMGTSQLNSKDEVVGTKWSDKVGEASASLGIMADVPVIGPYAKAASVIGGGVSKVMRFFGFSHPVPGGPVQYSAMNPTTGMAVTQGSVAYDILAADPANGLAVGNAGLGFDCGDELALKNIVTRPGYLGAGMWESSTSADERIFASCVSPEIHFWNTLSNGPSGWIYDQHWMTPMSHTSAAFAYWRGDITFTVKFFPSRFHRGKVKLTYEPAGEVGSTTKTDTSRQLSKIVDLAYASEVDFTIPYMSTTEWLHINEDYLGSVIPSPATQHFEFGDLSGLGYDSRAHNGTFRLDVLNRLTGPNAVDGVPFIIMIRGAENLEFAQPKQISNRFSYLPLATVNSQDETVTGGTLVPASEEPGSHLRYMGETILSIRELIKRMTFYTSITPHPSSKTLTKARVQIRMKRLPLTPGPRSQVDQSVRNRANTANVPYLIAANNYITWFYSAFLGVRGGVYWRFVPNEPSFDSTSNTMTVSRTQEEDSTYKGLLAETVSREEIFGSYASTTHDIPAYVNVFDSTSTWPLTTGFGASVATSRVNPQNGVSVPMYSQNKFRSTRALDGIVDESVPNGDGNFDNIIIQKDFLSSGVANAPVPTIDAYVAAADDMSFVFYCGPPPIYYGASPFNSQ